MAHEPRLAGWDARRNERPGRAVRQGAATDQRIARRSPRPAKRPVLSAGAVTWPTHRPCARRPAGPGQRRPRPRRAGAVDSRRAGAFRRRRSLPAGRAAPLPAAAAGRPVAHPAGAGDAGEAGPQRRLAEPGTPLPGAATMGLRHDATLAAGSTVGYAVALMDSRPAPQGGTGS